MNRRQVLAASAASLGYFHLAPAFSAAKVDGANGKVYFAGIGIKGKGDSDINDAAECAKIFGGEIVAICDIEDGRLNSKANQKGIPDPKDNKKTKYPDEQLFIKAKQFTDFRKLFDDTALLKTIDAFTVSTPDHNHALASILAMRAGKHVYCQKPLTHDVYEAHLMRAEAKKNKVCTQMGNQGTAANGLRRAAELLRKGELGDVTEVHVWTNRPIWPQAPGVTDKKPPKTGDVPKGVHWDEFLGVAPEREYAGGIHPFAWRGFWDYGTGAIGDMACHTANMAFMALKLGYPTSVEAESAGINPYSFPKWSTITYRFPARDDMPPVKWVWYDGKKSRIHKDGKRTEEKNLPPIDLPGQKSDSGCIMIGKYGMLYSPNDYGARYYLVLNDEFTSFTAPKPYLPRTKGHHKEWVDACKGGAPGMANFDYAAFLTEVVVLGNVALRLARKIEWDGPNMKATNCPEAEQYIKREYRKGWSL
jgi:predicted dehydrogenase